MAFPPKLFWRKAGPDSDLDIRVLPAQNLLLIASTTQCRRPEIDAQGWVPDLRCPQEVLLGGTERARKADEVTHIDYRLPLNPCSPGVDAPW